MSGGRPATRRLFFALWPDPATRRALGNALGAVLATAGGQAVPAGELHLTLEFLGRIPDGALETLAALGAAIALPDEALLLDRLEWWRRSALLVATPSASAAGLLAAQAQLRQALGDHGFRVDSRPFRPHVTLARVRHARPSMVARFLADTGGLRVAPFVAPRFVLLSSRPGRGGGPYALEAAVDLADD